MRCKHFEAEYQDLTKQIESFEATCHAPSMKLLKLVVRANQDEEAKKLLMLFNKTPSPKFKVAHSRTVLLMDATGSMSGLIDKVKKTITTVFRRVKDDLEEKELDTNCFETQLCAYRNYNSVPSKLLEVSPWSTETATLETFMSGIQSSGGNRNEAIEIGLWHVNNEANKDGGVTQAILIGDMPPNTQEEVNTKRGSRDWSQTPYATPTFFQNEINALARREPPIPVHCFHVESDDWPGESAQAAFAKIAEDTGGKADALDIHSERGAENLIDLLTAGVEYDISREDESLREKLLKDCSVTFGA